MLRRWKEKERWTGRRRSEPCGGEEEEEAEEEGQTDKRTVRRKSEPCGQMDKKMEEKKEGRTSEEEEVKRYRRRKSTSWTETKAGGETDRRCTPRRRSEPCGVLHVQLVPLANRKRKEMLQRRTGCRRSCSEEVQQEVQEEVRQMARGRPEAIGPLDNSKKIRKI